ncbi:hypothetical protein PYCC9005_003514 [Savitreella phatthalungensis]
MNKLVRALTPVHVRFNPEKPFVFGTWLNLLFAICTTFTVANLYYSQPILNQLADAFGVDDARVGRIPTLSQAGYATGLALISPLGDLVRRRFLLLSLVLSSTCLTIGLAVVSNLEAFEALSFFVGVSTVTPQVLLPLIGDLAAPERRATALALCMSGLLLGILIARVLAGAIQYATTYHVIYYFSIGVQAVILVLLYLFLPDYPAKRGHGLSYFGILRSTALMLFRYPTLVQSCMISGLMSASFINFWVTSTFLLGGPQYGYNSLEIGLFALLGIVGVCVAPMAGRVIDRWTPWHASLVGCSISMIGQLVGLASGISLGGVIPQIFFMDVGQTTQQIANQKRIFGLDPLARARVNANFIIFIFLGQTMGSGVGTRLYTKYGWYASQGFAVGCVGLALVFCLSRAPDQDEDVWVPWRGRQHHGPPAGEKLSSLSPPATLQAEKDTAFQKGPDGAADLTRSPSIESLGRAPTAL